MKNINWVRFFLGGLAASVIAFATDGFMHNNIVAESWKGVFNAAHAAPPPHHWSSFIYFGIFEIGRGYLAMFVYVLLRDRTGPGPKTAAVAGVISWAAFSLTGPAQFIPLGFFSNELWLIAGACQFVTSVVSAIAAGAVYKNP